MRPSVSSKAVQGDGRHGPVQWKYTMRLGPHTQDDDIPGDGLPPSATMGVLEYIFGIYVGEDEHGVEADGHGLFRAEGVCTN